MNREELSKLNDLVNSKEYKEIKKYALDYIVDLSISAINPETIKGMLQLLAYIDSWESKFRAELAKARRENERNN